MLRYCANLKAIRYESTSLNRIVGDKSRRVIVAYADYSQKSLNCYVSLINACFGFGTRQSTDLN